MEGETEGIVRNIVALTTVEEVLLEVVTDGKERAASCVRGTVDTIGAESALYGSTCDRRELRRELG